VLELLRDPAWQFVGALLALLTIAVTVWLFILQSPRRRLLVERIARVPFITIGADRIPGLRLTVDDRLVEEATVVLVRITNIGNAPLQSSDFEVPISLQFAPGSHVLDAQISEAQPEGLPIEVQRQDAVVTFSRGLLNPGDTFTCRVLVQDSKGTYLPMARVAGVRHLDTARPVSVVRSAVMLTAIVVLLVSVLLSPKPMSTGLLSVRADEVPYLLANVVSLLVLMVGLFADLNSLLRRLRDRMVLLRGGDA
jgi:hypothetical protein